MQAIFPSGSSFEQDDELSVDELQTLRFMNLFGKATDLKSITSKVKTCNTAVLCKLSRLGLVDQKRPNVFILSEKGREQIQKTTKR